MITQKLHSNIADVIMIICCFLLLFSTGCVTTPEDEQLETNSVSDYELWPYMDWRTNGGEEIRYREYLDSKSSGVTVRPSGNLYKHGDGWFLEDIKKQLETYPY